MYRKEDVAALAEAIGTYKIDPPIEAGETHSFGLGLDLYDPISGEIITVARPGRADIGQAEVLLTPDAVSHAIQSARLNRLHAVRQAGFASLEDADAAAVRAAEGRALVLKQAAELRDLQEKHGEATAAAAAEAQPKSDKPSETPEQIRAREDQEERDRLAAAQAQRNVRPQPRPAV